MLHSLLHRLGADPWFWVCLLPGIIGILPLCHSALARQRWWTFSRIAFFVTALAASERMVHAYRRASDPCNLSSMMPPGYRRVPCQGVDTYVARIVSPEGTEIEFSGGDLDPDPAQRERFLWFSERRAKDGQQVYVALLPTLSWEKYPSLCVSYAWSYCSFRVQVKDEEEQQKMLGIILSYEPPPR